MREMLKKIVALGLVGLFLVVSFAVAEDSIGPYDPKADVNRDGTVDILDLVEVGQAYGSNYTLMTQPNKTVVTVLSYANDPPTVEDARVAIFSSPNWYVTSIGYTNSSGIVIFNLSANRSYKAVAWSDSAYDYANFTTNSKGEASVVIWLGVKSQLPKGWIVISYLDNETHSLAYGIIARTFIEEIRWDTSGSQWQWEYRCDWIIHTTPLRAETDTSFYDFKPNTSHVVSTRAIDPDSNYTIVHSSTFQTDDDVCANVIVYASP